MNSNSAVSISVPELVTLRQSSQGILLRPSRVLSRQSGNYQSCFKGRGMEFNESRPYEPGDDIRNLDWRVMARTGKAHTKLFHEERERPVFFSIDFRAPMFFATRGIYKSVMASHLASLLAWNVSQHNDRVGGLIFSDHEHTEIKPQRGKTGVLRLIQSLVSHSGWLNHDTVRDNHENPHRDKGQNANRNITTHITDALLRLRRIARPGSLVFFLSDFRGLDKVAMEQMQQLAKHNELVLLFIVDPLEKALPTSGRYRISDGHREMTLDTVDKNLLMSYQENFKEREKLIEIMSQKGRMTLLKIFTTDDAKTTLQNTFAIRS